MGKIKYETVYDFNLIKELGNGDVFVIDRFQPETMLAIRNMSDMPIKTINEYIKAAEEEKGRFEFYKIVRE